MKILLFLLFISSYVNVLIKVFEVGFHKNVCIGMYVLGYRGSVDDWDVYFDVVT